RSFGDEFPSAKGNPGGTAQANRGAGHSRLSTDRSPGHQSATARVEGNRGHRKSCQERELQSRSDRKQQKWLTADPRAVVTLSVVGSDVRHWHVPVRQQNLKPALLFAFVCFLVRPELFDERLLIWICSGCDRRVLELDRDSVIPARILCHVVCWRFNLHGQRASVLHKSLQQGIVVLKEEL